MAAIPVDDFGICMSSFQVDWRSHHIQSTEWGVWQGKPYPWILPYELWEEGLWSGIRSGSPCSLPGYLHKNKVQKHAGVHNLKSSWIVCANLYYPFGASEEGRALLAGFLRAHVSPAIESVDAVELEYAEPEKSPLHPSSLLGEQGGGRGAGQTSPDVAFLVNGRRGLILTENKFVEHSFYGCSARTRKDSTERPGNPDPTRCKKPLAVLDDPTTQCHQVQWGRKYWALLAPVVDREMLSHLHCCPAAWAGYQLFRQQALAEGIADSGTYDWVVSCVALDERNETLRRCLRSTGLEDVRRWGKLFSGKAEFAVFSHQEWITWVRKHDKVGEWSDWLAYIGARYGY